MIVKLSAFSRKEDVEKWDNFVIKFGRLYHRSHWAAIIPSVYIFRLFSPYLESDIKIMLIFPLFMVKPAVYYQE